MRGVVSRALGSNDSPGGDMATRTAPLIPTGTWSVDPVHSSVEFSVKHMGIANVRGRFTDFQGTVEVGKDAWSAKARGSIKVASIDTGEAQRDTHHSKAPIGRWQYQVEQELETSGLAWTIL